MSKLSLPIEKSDVTISVDAFRGHVERNSFIEFRVISLTRTLPPRIPDHATQQKSTRSVISRYTMKRDTRSGGSGAETKKVCSRSVVWRRYSSFLRLRKLLAKEYGAAVVNALTFPGKNMMLGKYNERKLEERCHMLNLFMQVGFFLCCCSSSPLYAVVGCY